MSKNRYCLAIESIKFLSKIKGNWCIIMKENKFTWLRKINSPMVFQGHVKRKNYFEGWYYRQVSADRKKVICFIPGISLVEGDAHSFVQYIYVSEDKEGKSIVKTGYLTYPVESFKFSNTPFSIQIGENIFSESKVKINLIDKDIRIVGTFKLGSFTTIKKSILMPNIMGCFAYIPNMECNHGVISMSHSIQGNLQINHEKVFLDNGTGYLEKDWGTSFPKKYIWIQCNNFNNKSVSLFCSIAHIPFLKGSFTGFICNVVIDNFEFRFATYNHSSFNIKYVSANRVKLLLENSKAMVEIQGVINESGELIAPKRGKMGEKIKEESAGQVRLRLYNKEDKRTYEEYGYAAGIEIVRY